MRGGNSTSGGLGKTGMGADGGGFTMGGDFGM